MTELVKSQTKNSLMFIIVYIAGSHRFQTLVGFDHFEDLLNRTAIFPKAMEIYLGCREAQ